MTLAPGISMLYISARVSVFTVAGLAIGNLFYGAPQRAPFFLWSFDC